jgi:methionine-rich copper-binding protein CopC
MTAFASGVTGRGVTSPVTLRIRRLLLFVLPGVLAGVAMIVTAAPASADELIFASPAEGEELDRSPNSVQLSFDGFVRAGSELDVVGPDGPADLGKERRTGISLTQRLQSDLPAGVYTVVWDVTLQNGDSSDGEYTFVVLTGPDPDPEPSRATTSTTPSPTTTETVAPSPRWTPSTVAPATSQDAALIGPDDTSSGSATGGGNMIIGLFSLIAAAGIAGTLFYGWRTGWWAPSPSRATAGSWNSQTETSELPVTPYDG